ncbi:hypothetical protein LOTGIDRAFT_108713 [Lottia gigantea]|uniref:ER membrane protein complex subunit 4 n=1 Tax=Lottia gigantea TaxID=225164 RepID=V4B2L5_LOTGI|nr:hypothetical protein LOTGIDRAFT_108713 [Lottia gigantea]ESO82699.1 hypothetical protein LOTGIDRAFT_108713 [Lottia gigantea]
MASRTKKHKWAIDFSGSGRSVVASNEIVSPVGLMDSSCVSDRTKDVDPNLIVKRSWDVALAPVKQVPMNMFIMWMAGNSISIFPIMMVGMMFIRPIYAILALQKTFKDIEGDQAPFQKLVFIMGNVFCLAMAVYKCHVMGLLPTHTSDWLAFVQAQERMEWCGGGILLS